MENKGFMLVELVVVTGIIALMLGLALPNYRQANQQLTLDRAAHRLAQDFRRTQEMAMSGQFSAKTAGLFPAGGYGITFQKIANESGYSLFGDADNDHEYDIDDYLVEDIVMEKGIAIFSIQTSDGATNNLAVSFLPPNPTIFFNPSPSAGWVRITLVNERDLAQTKTVFVNKAGLVSIE